MAFVDYPLAVGGYPRPDCSLIQNVGKPLNRAVNQQNHMKTLNTSVVITSLMLATASAGTINFDDAKPGEAPAGWTATKTGSGAAKWTIEKDDSAPSKPNVLKQSGQASYPVCIKDDTNLKDGFVE